MRCLICSSTALTALYGGIRDRYRMATGEFCFLQCETCGSATLDSPPAAEALAALYPPRYTFKRSTLGMGGLRAALAALE